MALASFAKVCCCVNVHHLGDSRSQQTIQSVSTTFCIDPDDTPSPLDHFSRTLSALDDVYAMLGDQTAHVTITALLGASDRLAGTRAQHADLLDLVADAQQHTERLAAAAMVDINAPADTRDEYNRRATRAFIARRDAQLFSAEYVENSNEQIRASKVVNS